MISSTWQRPDADAGDPHVGARFILKTWRFAVVGGGGNGDGREMSRDTKVGGTVTQARVEATKGRRAGKVSSKLLIEVAYSLKLSG